MRHKKLILLAVVCLLVLGLVAFQSAWLAAARPALPLDNNLVNKSASETLDQPGRIFWYEETFGETEVAYLPDHDHLYFPIGVTVDSADNLWVVEYMGAVAAKYSGAGTFLKSIGKEGFELLADETHFASPYDAATDSSGNLWVTDGNAHRVAKFDAAGDYLTQLGITWEAGSDNTHFNNPYGVAMDSAGRIFVSDPGNDRVQVFSSTGLYIQTLGVTDEPGSDNAHFTGPRHLAVDLDDNLYVVDRYNHRVQIFDENLNYAATIGVSGEPGSDKDHLNGPAGVAVDATRIYVADADNHRVQIFDRDDLTYLATLGTGWGSGNYEFDTPVDIAVDSTGAVYVADLNNYRVQKYNSSLVYKRTFGVTGVPYLTDAYHYNNPMDVAVDEAGNMAIVEDWGRGQRLIVLDANGDSKFTIGEPGIAGNDGDHFNDPRGVAFDSTGNVYVAECGNHRVQIFSSTGTLLATLGSGPGTGEQNFSCPAGVAVDGSGNIYVADSDNHRIQIFDSSRAHVATIGVTGVPGTNNAHFNWPNDVEVDAGGNIFVADTANHRVQVFDSNLDWQMKLGVTGVCGDDNAHFCEPMGVAVDELGNIYVAEKFNPRVQVFNEIGVYYTTIGGTWGSQVNQFRFLYGLDVDNDGNVYVADLNNHRVEKYEPGKQLFLPVAIRNPE